MKKIFIAILGIVLLVAGAWFFITNNSDKTSTQEQVVLKDTYDLSKEYLSLRYRTDNILVYAKDYPNYEAWNKDMIILIKDWESLTNQSQNLEQSAQKVAQEVAFNFQLVKSASAYSAKQISDIYDKAPRFKGISTLAKHLGVDAKRAQTILDQAQAEITSGVFTEEGDAFENLEHTAIVVKDGCKVAGFVGGVVLTGGVAGIATAGTLTQTAVIVTGVDLALEVTEDSAQIAFGDKNKVSSFVKDVRTVTEPIANVLTITNIPSNLGNAFGKFDSVMIGLEQFREAAQEGKVIGIDLTNFEYHPPFQVIKKTQYPGTVSVAEMEMAEVEEWLKSLNKEYQPMTKEEVEKFLSTPAESEQSEPTVAEVKPTDEASQPTEPAKSAVTSKSMAGSYSGTALLQSVEEDVESAESLPVILQLNESGTGTVNVEGFTGEASYGGSNVSFSVSMKQEGVRVNGIFSGRATQSGSSVVINGTLRFSMMGITFARYSLSMQK